jgi:hypothetical protein
MHEKEHEEKRGKARHIKDLQGKGEEKAGAKVGKKAGETSPPSLILISTAERYYSVRFSEKSLHK